MASVVLKSVGSAVGNAFLPGIGGALLGGFGANLGNIIDGRLGLGTTVTGPMLQNLSVQDSRYGAGIQIVYGNARLAGNVIWSTDLMQTQHNSSVGHSYYYSLSVATAQVCDITGEIRVRS